MIIGIYGKIGSGKTTFSKIITKFNDYQIIQLDDIAHDLLMNNKKLIDDLKNNKIGTYCIDDDKVNFKKLTKLVFNSYRTNKAVSGDIWPYVKQEVDKIIKEAKAKGNNLIIEAATLPALNIEGIDELVYIKRNIGLIKLFKIAKLKKKNVFQIFNIIRIQKKYNHKYIKHSYIYKNLL